jgi:hypothetical protein
MSVAHVDLLAPELEAATARRTHRRAALLLGCAVALVLAAVPTAISFLLFTRPDLFLAN